MPSALTLIRAIGLAALTLAASTSDAQSWTGGFKSGIGNGSFTGHSEFDWRPAFSAVGFLNRRTNGRWSEQIEVGTSRAYGVSNVLASSTTTFVADYLNAPLLLNFSLPGAFGLKPYVLAGPSLSLRLSCALDFVAGSLSSRTPCDNSVFFDRVDAGVAGGAGFGWQFRRTTFSLEGRGSYNFRSIIVPLDSKGLKTWSWGVLIGAAVPVHFARRRPTIGIIPPGYALVPISGTLAEGLPGAPVSAPTASVPESTRRITVTAADADARSLLIAIAREAGISLVVSSDVRRRVSVSLTNAPAEEAIAAIIAEAGLSIARPSQTAPAVVFYQLAVNVNQAPAETISARFGVSSDLAKWLVDARAPKSP